MLLLAHPQQCQQEADSFSQQGAATMTCASCVVGMRVSRLNLHDRERLRCRRSGTATACRQSLLRKESTTSAAFAATRMQ